MELRNLRVSPLVGAATSARRATPWWLAAALVVGVVVAGTAVGGFVAPWFGAVSSAPQGAPLSPWPGLFTHAGMLLALWAWLRLRERRSLASVGFLGRAAGVQFCIGLLIGTGLVTLCIVVLLLLGQYQPVPARPGAAVGTAALLPVLALCAAWTVQSSTQEVLMRGYLLQTASLQLPGWLAILLPGLLFSALHFVGGAFLPVAGLNITLFAVVASLLALRQGSLWMVCGLHTGWNWSQAHLFGVPVGGSAYDTGLFALAPAASASPWLTGGTFGPENSGVVTLVLAAVTAGAYRSFRSDQACRACGRPASADL